MHGPTALFTDIVMSPQPVASEAHGRADQGPCPLAAGFVPWIDRNIRLTTTSRPLNQKKEGLLLDWEVYTLILVYTFTVNWWNSWRHSTTRLARGP
ncbi:unnamed protein product [Cylicostephanus goldi]|uniref:Uncharacterized protein n=1 Tax=Cylicostephanus goldi TaxID=71465 RepID=A0A3P6S8R3_CYLGO|nr:unnamed protein product [Cylicostephanus goldi]